MKTSIVFLGTVAAGIAAMIGHLSAQATPKPGEGGVAAGIDVIIGAVQSNAKFGSTTTDEGETIMAYAFGLSTCNIGDAPVAYEATTTNHPVAPQNVYRVRHGRIEQIGMSWGLHGVCALEQTLCGTCTSAGVVCAALGAGCSDTNSATASGASGALGPRSQVNAATGAFSYPFWSPPVPPVIGRRVQVNGDDLDPAMNPGARYFAEGHSIHPQDAAAGNGHNNASHREFSIGPLTSGAYTLTLTGPTLQQQPAIYAWKAVHADVSLQTVAVEGDGRFHVGHRVIDNGDGTWRYEFAIHNLNSDRSGASFSVPVPAGVTVTNVGFHDVDYHSNEVYDNTDWTAAITDDGAVAWSSAQSYAENPNANALRWSTTYSFWFTADAAPQDATATLGLFKPGIPTSMPLIVQAPGARAVALADVNQDGVVDGEDLAIVLGAWGSCAGCPGDINDDGVVDGSDLAIVLGGWAP